MSDKPDPWPKLWERHAERFGIFRCDLLTPEESRSYGSESQRQEFKRWFLAHIPLPCPFCGHSPHVDEAYAGRKYYRHRCLMLDVCLQVRSFRFEDWNRSATPEIELARLRLLAEMEATDGEED